jgi:uncharacterized protein (DUF342 family)
MDAPPTIPGAIPELRVAVAGDRLQAHVAASPRPAPGSPPRQTLYRHRLIEQLQRAGVVFGLLEPEIERLVAAYNAQGFVPEPVLVAAGQPPVPAELAKPTVLVPALTDPAQIERLRSRTAPHFHDVLETGGGPAPAPVGAGAVVARYTVAVPGRPGVGVDGTSIAEPAPAVGKLAGPGVALDPLSLEATARRPGIVVHDGQALDVLAVGLDAVAEIKVDEGAQSCAARLTPPGPGGTPLTSDSVLKALAAAGVKMGINRAAVEEAVAEASRAGARVTRVVAEGRLPKDGFDAQLEQLVDISAAVVPLEERGGRVDWKGISIICSVSANQELVRRWPGAKGVPGYTVLGKILPAYNGREVRLPRGRNVMPHPADPNLLIAKIAGHVRAADGGLEVQECFSVGGDVDYATGHIAFERTVHIKGDIKAGFNAEVGGDLEVGGIVEDCQVKAGGNVLIRRGFVGNGGGVLEAGGNVYIAFGRNQTVRAGGAVTFEREAINMNTTCRSVVTVSGLLVGGRTLARDRVTCKVLGNSGGTRTEVEVGVDHYLLRQRAQLEDDIRRLRKLQSRGLGGAGELIRLSAAAGQDEATLGQMSAPELDALIDLLEDRRRLMLEQAYAGESATLIVQERACAGVWIRIGNSAQRKISEHLPGPLVFALREGEVRWT